MKKLLIAAIAMIFVSSNIFAAEETDKEAFDYVCNYVEVFYDLECGDITPPIIVRTKLMGRDSMGVHIKGEPYIFINPIYSEEQQKYVVVHETAHFVLFWASKDKYKRCSSEEIARRVTYSWRGKEYSDKWRKIYQCSS